MIVCLHETCFDLISDQIWNQLVYIEVCFDLWLEQINCLCMLKRALISVDQIKYQFVYTEACFDLLFGTLKPALISVRSLMPASISAGTLKGALISC